MTVSHDPRSWRAFAATLCCSALAVGAVLYGFVLLLDPYGLRATRPIMDLNQRFMYPQIVRSGRFDAALFGTSTVRLLDPDRLNAVLGGRFVNLGLNSGTPWEQMQLADLFLRQVPEPKALVFGLDRNWCDADADRKRLTFRVFPPWLYDESRARRLREAVESEERGDRRPAGAPLRRPDARTHPRRRLRNLRAR